MIRSRPPLKLCGWMLPLMVGVAMAGVLLASMPVRSAQNPIPPNSAAVASPPSAVNNQASVTTPTPKGEPEKSYLEKTKTDAAELSALADQLRDELNKLNAHTLSLDVLQKTEKIEKLAKKIKGEANGR